MKIGWIKLHRQFKEWEWYNKSEMVHLFIHCLIKANFKDSSFQGRECKKGSFITSLNHLSKETNISIQTVRTCLKKLELTKEITIESTHKLTHITICNFDSYQEEEVTTNKQTTRKQHATNKQLTTIEERKEDKEDIDTPTSFDFKKSLLSFGFNLNLVNEWLKVRKAKNLTNTETALKKFIKQVELTGLDKNLVLEKCVEKSWGGFESSWITNVIVQQNNNQVKVLGTTKDGEVVTDQYVYSVYKQMGKI